MNYPTQQVDQVHLLEHKMLVSGIDSKVLQNRDWGMSGMYAYKLKKINLISGRPSSRSYCSCFVRFFNP